MSSASSPPLSWPPAPTGFPMRRAAMRQSPAPPAIGERCATSPEWTYWTSGMPGSRTATSWRCCRRNTKHSLKNGSPKRRRPGVTSWRFPKLAGHAFGRPRIRDMPPTIFHPDPSHPGNMEIIRASVPQYRETLAPDRRVLLDRYQLADAAIKLSASAASAHCAWWR